MLENNGYQYPSLDDVKLYLQYLVYDAPYESKEEYDLVLQEFDDSYTSVIKSFDKQLLAEVESIMVADKEFFEPYTRSGPMALAVGLQLCTVTTPHVIRQLVEQVAVLDLRKIEGESIADYINKSRTLLNRVPNHKDRADEFYDITFNALKKCSVPDFVFDIQSWHAARKYTPAALLDNGKVYDHEALLKHALASYHEMVNGGKWLPSKRSINLAKKAAKKKSEEDAKPADASALATTKSNADKLVEQRKKAKWPAWRREPPKKGEPLEKTTDKGNTVHWCTECKFWGNHPLKLHKTREELAAEREAKKKDSEKKGGQSKTTSFSDGTAPDSKL
jgi:hypothetical protein